jgi:hypothetical protein
MSIRALKDIPLQEITIRKYEAPNPDNRRECVKKFLLSIGLLQPGDSRDVIVDIFLLLLEQKIKKQPIFIRDILEKLKGKQGASPPNVRRQLRRLKSLKLIEKTQFGYRITEFSSIEPIINNYLLNYVVNPSIERIKDYAKILDNL